MGQMFRTAVALLALVVNGLAQTNITSSCIRVVDDTSSGDEASFAFTMEGVNHLQDKSVVSACTS